MHKKSKVINTREKKTSTPNLTLYYPLEMSILSVSIRFMGSILLLVFTFCISFFLILNFLNISLEFVSFIFLLNLFLLISTSFYHTVNSLSHFIDDSKNELRLNLFKKFFK
jgi:predicted membrane channel-forming protein YqfA (hemolysin III family)